MKKPFSMPGITARGQQLAGLNTCGKAGCQGK